MESVEDGVWPGESSNKVTRVGTWLRSLRLDELPQFFNVLRGDMSFVGPRPDMVGLAERLRSEIPHYDVRTLIKPGLSGWAQIKQKVVPHSVAETHERFAYDLYYIKHRSFLLDVYIIVRTIHTLLRRVGK